MKDGNIGVIDSGVGGISVLLDMVKEFKNERFIYFGDNKNAPYGNLDKNKLFELCEKNLRFMLSFNVKAIVFACNTVSVTLLKDLRKISPVPVFGVFPPVRKNVNDKRVLLLSTNLTAQRYSDYKITVFGLKNLAKDIENNADNLCNIDLKNHFSSMITEKGYYHTVILGCTHYCFLENEIYNHFCPQKVVSGNQNTVNRVSRFLKKSKSLYKTRRNGVEFIGENADFNFKFYNLVVKKYYNLNKND